MLAIGVGGADAVDAMTGTPWELKAPQVVGKISMRLCVKCFSLSCFQVFILLANSTDGLHQRT